MPMGCYDDINNNNDADYCKMSNKLGKLTKKYLSFTLAGIEELGSSRNTQSFLRELLELQVHFCWLQPRPAAKDDEKNNI